MPLHHHLLRPFGLFIILISVACEPAYDFARQEDGVIEYQGDEPLSGLPDPSATEVDDPCDGFDNDVDGEVDEGCYCEQREVQHCYPDHPKFLGVGRCHAGLQRCEGVSGDFQLGSWGECVGAVLPAHDICDNGIDEDCDGEDLACPPVVDECAPGETRSCYTGPPETQGVGLCGAGEQLCEPAATWGVCVGAVLPHQEICGNSLDEDCDGSDLACESLG